DRVEVVFRRVPGHEKVVREAESGESKWEDQPGKAEEGVGEQGVGEKGGWIRTKDEMARQGLAGAEALTPAEHHHGDKTQGNTRQHGHHEQKLGGEKDLETKRKEKEEGNEDVKKEGMVSPKDNEAVASELEERRST